MLSIRWRLTLTYTGVLALSILVFSVALYAALQQYLWRQTDHALATRAAEITRRLNMPGMHGWRGGMLLPYTSVFAYPDTYVQIVDASGEVVARSANLGTESLPVLAGTLETARQNGAFWQTLETDGRKLRVYNLPFVTGNNRLIGVLQVGRSLEPIYTVLHRLMLALFGVGLVMIVMATGAGYYLARTALAPVDHLTRVAMAISETRDLERRVEYRGPEDEIGRLAAAFNNMVARLATAQRSLAEAYAAQRRFVADVSHELRTPLTIIRGNLELLQQMDQGDTAWREILADATGEAERMSRLLNNLLILARADAGQHIEKAPLDLGALVQDVARQAPLLGPNPFRTRDLDTLAGAQIMGNADYLKQLFLILLDNAFKYTPPAGEITLAATCKEGWYAVSVTDTGPGIPPEEIPRIFERFFRGQAGRTTGTGLGLAIARWIAEEHGGRLEVVSRAGQGSTFTVWFPAIQKNNS